MLFLSTPFDLDSANFLRKIVDVIKIASGDNTFLPLIDRCISFKKPIIISTGLLKDNEIIKLYNYLKKKVDLKKVCLMHCVSSYPVENKDANIGYISHLKKKFKKITIGYSDHTIGPEASILAATLGSKVIEKHFTINKNYSSFRDHQLSADISELKLISKFIKKIKILLGKGKKNNLSKSEIKNLKLLRRSIYAAKNIKKKEVFSEKNIIHLRPFKKNNISKYKSILNRKSKKTFRKGELI